MKTPWTKGQWYYEIQILALVFMWQHNMEHKSQSDYGFRLGRFFVWNDSAWLHHGFGRKLDRAVRWAIKPFTVALKFLRSLNAFLKLSRAGFHISFSENKDYGSEMYRFWWGDRIIKDMADIDNVCGHWNTMSNGHSESLDKRKAAW